MAESVLGCVPCGSRRMLWGEKIMSIHSLPDVPGVDVADLLAREMAGDDTVESQDNPSRDDWELLAEERRQADWAYYRTVGKPQHRRKYSV